MTYAIYGDHIQLSGVLFADNIAPVLGSALAFIQGGMNNVPLELKYIEYSLWEGNQSKVSSTLSNNPNIRELIWNEGVLLGNLGPGWTDQGSLVVRFQIK
jgi:hypothetical protein